MAQLVTRQQDKDKDQEIDLNISQPKRKFSPKKLIPLVLLLAAVGGGTWYYLKPTPIKPLQVSGRIEGYETNIGAKFAGRIQFVAVREGDQVKKGQVIVRMDDADIQAQLQAVAAQLMATQQLEQQARLQINVLENQIQEWQLNLQQAKQDAQGKVLQAESNLASSMAQMNQAQAQLEQAKAELKLAQINRDRYKKLVIEGAVAQQQFDQYQTALETALATVRARQSSVESYQKLVQSAQGQLTQAKTTQFNPGIRQAQLEGLYNQLKQAQSKLAAAQADIAQIKANEKEIKSKISDLRVISPIDGVVISRSVEPGAVVTTGKTLLTVIDPKEVYLRGFIPEGDIGKIWIGKPAEVFLDSAPNKPLQGKVSAVDTQASFTPENIYFKEDRVKQVFGVKISIDNPQSLAKPGMPADAQFSSEQ